MTWKMNEKYQPIIGLEIHVELKTKQKMFCGCSAYHFQVEPNTHTCPVCLGTPGALPVTNRQAIEWCQLIGLAFNCKLAKFSKFDRKNYFYPDLAKSYQISQLDKPLCGKGYFQLSNGTKIGITRVHMEEDTGKNVHKDGKTLIDFNRCGVPLVEIVTEPDFRNKQDVDEFLKSLRQIIRSLGVSDADMEKGSMRLELNMSLTPNVETQNLASLPNYKVEVKNINSFRYLQKAIDFEYQRQSEVLDQGETPDQETRGWQEDVGKTISQRSKEESQDYRYFPEPDLPPMTFTDKDFNKLKSQLPELPQAKIARFKKDFALDSETASFLIEGSGLADYFEQAVKVDDKIIPKQIANVIKNKKFDWQKLTPEQLIEKIKSQSASQISDEAELTKIIEEVITQNPKIVEEYKSGKVQVIGFLIGQIMKATQGKADAKLTQQLLKKLLV
jgi:aspartyl-tRNA(Asn)/glutamyl-tRNA(Gln) amidotransferase subunit B